MALPTLTITGNVTADPDFRRTQNGKAVVSFTVAASKRKKNAETNEWEDAGKLFVRATAWDLLAEAISAELAKGMRVVVIGELSEREYQSKEGESRRSLDLNVHEVAISVRPLKESGAGQSWDSAQPATSFAVEESTPF